NRIIETGESDSASTIRVVPGSAGATLRASGQSTTDTDKVVVAPGRGGATARASVVGRSASVGTDSTVVLRGSLSTEAPPLVIIDGVVVTQATLQALDPLQIDRVEVLKGAAASQAYGER